MTQPSARRLAIQILDRIEATEAFADILLDGAVSKNSLNDADRRLLTELVYGTLRWQGRLDWIISRFSSVKPTKMERTLLNTLRTGVYQMLFLEKVPVSAVVNESVKMAKEAGQRQANFVNAVLRATDRGRGEIIYPDPVKEPEKHICTRYSHPDWLVRRLIAQLGFEETAGLCEANNSTPPLTIRVNRVRTSREEILNRLTEEGYDAAATRFSPAGIHLHRSGDITKIPGFHEGLWTVQDEASQLISFILDPKPGERVLDACAAPGGKTAHMAELMEDRGEIIAMDINPLGVYKIGENSRRLGLTAIKTLIHDSSHPVGFPEGCFDRILLDVPCSGSGVLRRHPEGKWRKTERNLTELTVIQKKLLENVSLYLKPGGIMVYSVCSVLEDEGKDMVDGFLTAHPEFGLEKPFPNNVSDFESFVCEKGLFRSYPHKHNTDGFFAACLRRR